jgi:hypothetical protein
MRQLPSRVLVIVVAAVLAPLAGCLNLGGRTTYVQDNTQTLGRLAALESRMGALEQSLVRATAAGIPTASNAVPEIEQP